MIATTAPEARSIAKLFQALGHENRVKLIEVLRHSGNALPVKALAEMAGISRHNASQHLKELLYVGLVTMEPRSEGGKTMHCYSVHGEVLQGLALRLGEDAP